MVRVKGWTVGLLLGAASAAPLNANPLPMCYHQAAGTCYVSSKPITSAEPRCMQVYKSYEEGEAECTKLGMAMVSIKSAAENEIVRKACGEQACYIGLHEPPNSENWAWADGTSLAGGYQNWKPGQPNNWRPENAGLHIEEDAALMNGWDGFDGRWSDVNGSVAKIGFVCKKAGTCSVEVAALDQCAMLTKDSLPVIDYDFKADGRTCEKPPTMTDGGSFCYKKTASSCYIAGRQAWDSKSCLKGGKIFQQARATCRNFNGDLVKIESAEEQAAVQEACGDQMCWIGYKEKWGTESWFWTADETSGGYGNWAPGQPDNGMNKGFDDSQWNKAASAAYDEDVAVMNLIPNMDGKWRDTYEKARFGFVCKVPAALCTPGVAPFAAGVKPLTTAMLSSVTQCEKVEPANMKSTSIKVFSFATQCDTKAMNTVYIAADEQNVDDEDKTVFIVVIVFLGVSVLVACVCALVFFAKYRKAKDTATREMTEGPPIVFGGAAA